jgi:hypothetical protein
LYKTIAFVAVELLEDYDGVFVDEMDKMISDAQYGSLGRVQRS